MRAVPGKIQARFGLVLTGISGEIRRSLHLRRAVFSEAAGRAVHSLAFINFTHVSFPQTHLIS